MRSGISIRNQISLFSVAALVLFLAGCQGSDTSGTASVRITLNTNAAEKATARRAAPAPSGIVSVTVDVSGPGMEPLSTASDANHDGVTTLALEVPAGPARRFDVTAFDNTGAARYQGNDTVDLVSGASVTLTIEMVVIQINPLQIDPPAAILTRSATQTFTLGEDAPSQVDFFVNGTAGGDDTAGRIAPDGTYTAPAVIPIDRTNPNDIGVPTAITVEAVDKSDPDRRDAAQVRVVTGLQLRFGPNFPVTPKASSFRPVSTISSGQRNIAYREGKVFVTWAEMRTGREGWNIFLAESSDGKGWAEIPVENGIEENFDANPTPTLAVGPDGTVYVVYREEVGSDCGSCPGLQRIILALRGPNDAEFRLIPLTPRTTLQFTVEEPTVAVSKDGTVYVAWSSNPQNGYHVFLQRLNKDGSSIDAIPRNLTENVGTTNYTDPLLTVGDNGTVYLLYERAFTDFLAVASQDGGNTFSLPGFVNDINFEVANPSIAAGPDGTVYVAWNNTACDCNPEVFFDTGRIDDGRLVFGEDRPIGKAFSDSVDQRTPSLAWDQSAGIYIGYVETLSGFDANGILLAKSRDGGETFTFSRIDDGSGSGEDKSDPSLTIDPAGRAFAVWTRFDFSSQGTDEVFFAMGDDFIDE